jgi:hypothetical protein
VKNKSVNLPASFPNFLVIGASKSGTSSLYAYLRQHEDIFLSYVKETHYFTNDQIYNLGPEEFAKKYYHGASEQKAIGDITPTYFVQPDLVIPRLHETFGELNPKFIVILRNPVERAWSHYQHKVRSGEEKLSFEKALEVEGERVADFPMGWWGYASEGLYSKYVKKWLSAYSKDNFLFLLTDDLAEKPQSVLREIYEFLDVNVSYEIDNYSRKNVSGSVRSELLLSVLGKQSSIKSIVKYLIPYRYRQILRTKMIEFNTSKSGGNDCVSVNIEDHLKKLYVSEITDLESLTGLDLSVWSL